MNNERHWDAAYSAGDAGVSWFQDSPTRSLELILAVDDLRSSVIDVGGGSSRLAEALVGLDWDDVSVLDVSDAALAIARERLGDSATAVEWIASDVISWEPSRRYDIWHDRAVLHFLTDHADRDAYLSNLRSALVPGGHVVIGVFAEDGPERCSGLVVRRYSHADLRAFLGEQFEIVLELSEEHLTPDGSAQRFNWIVAKLLG